MKPPKQRLPTLGEMERGECSKEELAPYLEEMHKTVTIAQERFKQVNDAIRRSFAEYDFSDLNGIATLCDAIEAALSKPEVKKSPISMEIGRKFIELLNTHPGIPKQLESVFDPVTAAAIKTHTTETHRRAGSTSKKKTGKEGALSCWKEWAEKPELYRNKTAFGKYLIAEKFCDTDKTAGLWVAEFRSSSPAPLLEKILPQKKL